MRRASAAFLEEVPVGQAIGDILPMAVGVAISVVPIIAIILMLITPKARSNGLAFALGWVLGLCVVGFGALAIANASGLSSSSTASDGADGGKLIFGLLFLLLAVRQWRSRPKPGEEPVVPGWMSAIDSFTPGKSLGLAALLSGVNPKNLLLTVSAAATVAQSPDLSGSQQVVVMVVFILIASLTILAPLGVYLAAGDRAVEILSDWKVWLSANNAAIMCVLFLVFGVFLIGQGIGGLS
jgi:threonine/homoserine/homoserine lactone efflux protein